MLLKHMGSNGKVHILIYTREECHLCRDAEAVIRRSPCSGDVEIEVVDIDTDPHLQSKYSNDVPVIFINGIKAFKYRLSPEEFCSKVRRLRNKSAKPWGRSFA